MMHLIWLTRIYYSEPLNEILANYAHPKAEEKTVLSLQDVVNTDHSGIAGLEDHNVSHTLPSHSINVVHTPPLALNQMLEVASVSVDG